jgi:hypothetical protein
MILTTTKGHEVGRTIPRHLVQVVELITNSRNRSADDGLAEGSLVSAEMLRWVETYIVKSHQEHPQHERCRQSHQTGTMSIVRGRVPTRGSAGALIRGIFGLESLFHR